jgi:hypothetical protein
MVKQNFNSGGATVDAFRTNARFGQNDRGYPCGNAIHRVSITDKCSDERRTCCTGRRRTDAMHRVSTMQYTIPSHDNIVLGKRKYLNVNNLILNNYGFRH